MKKIGLVLFSIIIGTLITDSTLAQTQGNNTALTVQKLDGFENPDSWIVKFSNQRCPKWQTGYLDMRNHEQGAANNAQDTTAGAPAANDGSREDNTQWIRWFNVDSFENAEKGAVLPHGIPKDQVETEKTVLGIKGCWLNRGFNWVAIEPKTPLYTEKDPASLSLWVWGTGYNYELYVTVKNETGRYFNLPIGTLNYYGWRQLKINFPAYIFPKQSHLAQNKLEIVRLKVVSGVDDESEGFYAYFDLLEVLHGNRYNSYSGNALSDHQW